MLGIGAISKSVQDARLINDIIAYSVPHERSLNSFSIVMPIETLKYPVDKDTHNALNKVKNYVEGTFKVIDEQPPYYNEAAKLWQQSMSINGGYDVAKLAFDNRPVHPFREYLKEVLFHSSDIHRYFTWSVIGAKLTQTSSKQLKDLEKIYI